MKHGTSLRARGIRALLMGLVATTTLGGQGVGRDTVRLSLADALRRADSISTSVVLARDTMGVAGTAVLEAYGRFLPAVAAGAGILQEQGTVLLSQTALAPSDTRFRAATGVLSTSLNLFNGFRDMRGLRATLATRDVARLSVERARQQVAFDITQAYEQAALDDRLIAVAEAARATSRARESQLDAQVTAGTRAPPDLYRQRAQSAADEVALIDARDRAVADRIALLRRLRLDPATPLALVASGEPVAAMPASSPEGLVAQALQARPDLGVAEARRTVAAAGVDVARAGYFPRVSLGLDLFASGRVFDWERLKGVDQLVAPQTSLLDQLGRQSAGALSLGMTWNLFDRNATRLDVERARLTAERERLADEDLRIRIAGEVRQVFNDVAAADQRLVAARAGEAAAVMAFDAVNGRYDAGLATFVDVLAAQGTLTAARATLAQAEANARLQRAALRYITGAAIDR